MILVLQIAGGIVLGVFILAYFRQLLALSFALVFGALLLALVIGGGYWASNNLHWESIGASALELLLIVGISLIVGLGFVALCKLSAKGFRMLLKVLSSLYSSSAFYKRRSETASKVHAEARKKLGY